MLPAGLAMSPEGAAALVGIASPTALGRGLPAPAEAPSGSTTGLCVSRGDRGLTCQLLLCGHSLLVLALPPSSVLHSARFGTPWLVPTPCSTG